VKEKPQSPPYSSPDPWLRHARDAITQAAHMLSAYQAKEMAWCASSQLTSFRDCRFRFYYGIFPRCALCPLFDAERAIRDVLGENPPPGTVFEITLGPNLRALLTGEMPSELDGQFDVPDYPPEEWGKDQPVPG
jgi:hypothetical protein